MRLLLPLLAVLSASAFCEDAPAVDLNKVPEVASVLKDMERASTEARIKEIQKAVKKLEPLVKKLANRDVRIAAEVAHKVDDLNKEAKELGEGLAEKPEFSFAGTWDCENGPHKYQFVLNDDKTLVCKLKNTPGKYVVNGKSVEITMDNNYKINLTVKDNKTLVGTGTNGSSYTFTKAK